MANRLEKIEWTQYWAEDCSDDKPYVLMVGDSISVGYRHFVYEKIRDRYCAVTVSSSKAVDNSSYLDEIRFISSEEERKYSVIHFNNGIHGYHLTTDEYTVCYEKAVRFLLANYPDASLILATSTPSTLPGANTSFAAWNTAIIERNEAVKRLARKYSLPVNDLYEAACLHPGYKADDGVHFTEEGYSYLADRVAEFILSVK